MSKSRKRPAARSPRSSVQPSAAKVEIAVLPAEGENPGSEADVPYVPDMDAEDQAAYEEYQAKLAENRARKAEAERLRLAAEQAEAITRATSTTPATTNAKDLIVDGWNLDAAELPAILTMRHENQPLSHLVLGQATLEDLLKDLNSIYVPADGTPVTWAVGLPDYGDEPVLTLMRGGEILASMIMDEDFGHKVGGMLARRYPTEQKEPLEPVLKRLKRWARKHWFLTGVIVLISLPFIYLSLAGVVASIVGSI